MTRKAYRIRILYAFLTLRGATGGKPFLEKRPVVSVNDLCDVDGLDGDGPVALYFKGHAGTVDVHRAACEYCEARGWDEPGPAYATWWRKVPNRREGGSVFKRAMRGRPGAFPVTVCDLRPWTTA